MSKDIRYTVPFIGCGFNSWLLGKDATSPILTSWKSLLENVAWSEGLFPDDDLSAVIESMHSPTFVWEKLIFRIAQQHGMKIAEAENHTFKRISIQIQNETKRLIKENSSICDRVNQFIKAITHNYSKKVDIVSLNYDHLLINLLKEQDGTWKDAFKSPYNPGISINSQYYETDFLRIWFPHGCIPSEAWTEKIKTRCYSNMVAGIHRYSRANTYVLQAIGRMRGDINKFKKEQNIFYNEESRTDLVYRNTHRIISQFSQSWVSTSIEAPILLLGTGLSKDELDLWTFFHRRARSTHYIQKQVPVWRFTHKNEGTSEEQHWNALTEGLNITNLQMGENWDEAWTLLLMLLEEENGIFQ